MKQQSSTFPFLAQSLSLTHATHKEERGLKVTKNNGYNPRQNYLQTFLAQFSNHKNLVRCTE
jgi:hypothetical protein